MDDAETNTEFASSVGADYPILSDPTKTAARAYGVLGATGFARRWTFFIDRDGRILAIDKQVSPSSHGNDVADRLLALGVPLRT